MAYRTYVNDVQVFGNNETHPEWIEFIKSQGIAVDEDDMYDGVITDFMAALSVIETIALKIEDNYRKNDNDSVFDIREDYEFLQKQADFERKYGEDKYKVSLFDANINRVRNGYAFLPFAFYMACVNCLEEDEHWAYPNHMNCFKAKKPIRVYAR